MDHDEHHPPSTRRTRGALLVVALVLAALSASPVAATMYSDLRGGDDGPVTELAASAERVAPRDQVDAAPTTVTEAPTTTGTPTTTSTEGEQVGKYAGTVAGKIGSTPPTTGQAADDGSAASTFRRAATTTKVSPTTTAKVSPTTTGAAPATPTGVLVDVTTYGATANDSTDDQRAIQAAFDDAPAGSTIVFPAGEYLHSALLTLRTEGVTLWGYGATLRATNISSHAIILAGNRTSIRGFTLLGSPTGRLSAEDQMGISLHFTDGSTVQDNVVRGTSSAGIFIWGASNYVVRNNTVENTKSDGIHSVAGANHGLVEGNTLRNVGDDCFAVISYVPERVMSHDIVIRNNSCTGGKARGVSVAGGVNVRIENNTIVSSAAAGIYLASDSSYDTWGAQSVQVIGNKLQGVNTNSAVRHGAIFLWSRAGSATTSDGVSYSFENRDITLSGNVITDTKNGAADIVAISPFGSRISFSGNTSTGSRPYSYFELAGNRYNLVGGTHNGEVVPDHVGDASIPR